MTAAVDTHGGSEWRRVIASVGSALVFGAAIWWLSRRLDWPAAWDSVRSASPSLLLAAAVINLASVSLAGVAWGVLLPSRGPGAVRLALRATWVGSAVNSLTPVNIGAVTRIAFYAREGGGPTSDAAAGLVIGRVLQAAAALLLFLAIAPFLEVSLPFDRTRIARLTIIAATAVALIIIVALAGKRTMSRSRIVRWFLDSLAAARKAASVPRLAASFALVTLAWVGQYLTLFLCARAVGLPVAAGGTLLLLATINLGFLARVTPGNAGVLQVIFVTTATFLGLPAAAAGAAAVLLQLLQTVPVLGLGAFALATTRQVRGVRAA